MFLMVCIGISDLLWLLLNILSYVLVCVYAIGNTFFKLIQWEDERGQKFPKWPGCLKIGTHQWILPFHFIMAGMWITYIINPVLGLWMILMVFLSFTFWEFLGIIISYLHKWTDEAGRPLWSSNRINPLGNTG